jgi:putative phosphoribosyl transferase
MIVTLQQYRDRIEGGQVLARHLAHYASRVDAVVLALPRGGVPVALEVANYLSAPLDAIIARKLARPENRDEAIGAIASGGVRMLDDEAIAHSGMTAQQVDELIQAETAELERRERLYRGNRPALHLAGRVVIVVDDGLATGSSMHAAVIALHRQQPAWLVVAAPVGSVEACEELAQEVHEVVCPLRPDHFEAVGLWYEHFSPVDDDEVREGLHRGRGFRRP